jgi:hypothetical protein
MSGLGWCLPLSQPCSVLIGFFSAYGKQGFLRYDLISQLLQQYQLRLNGLIQPPQTGGI